VTMVHLTSAKSLGVVGSCDHSTQLPVSRRQEWLVLVTMFLHLTCAKKIGVRGLVAMVVNFLFPEDRSGGVL
jgi:hypothetical protein